MGELENLRPKLKGKVIILGIGNTLRRDDGAGAVLASRLQAKSSFIVYEVSTCPENFMGKVIKEEPETILLVDAADLGRRPGEFRVLGAEELRTGNLFSTHNASISLTINYLQEHLKAAIFALLIQPETIAFGDTLSPEVERTLGLLEQWFIEAGKG